ncbi:MAG: hypothetical protein WA822_15515, partial [Albidovulum sp.]
FETAPPSFDKPLWQSGDLAPEGWLSAKNWWRKRGTAWEFWIKWYEDLLAGGEPDWALLEKIALIPDDIWQQGSEAVNARIAEIFVSSQDLRNTATAEALLGAALANYSFDALDRVMRMVPFDEDIRNLRDPERLGAFLDDADAVRDDFDLFREALASEGGMQGAGAVRTYLGGVTAELDRARQTDHLRVARLIELGKILEGFCYNESVAIEFGPLIEPLRAHVGTLLELTRRHFAATFTRMAPLHDISGSPDTDHWDLLQDIQRGIKLIADVRPDGLVPLAKDDQAVLSDLAGSIEGLLRQHHIVPVGPTKNSLRKEIDYRISLVVVSIALFFDRAREQEAGPGEAVDSVLNNYKRGMGLRELWEFVKAHI